MARRRKEEKETRERVVMAPNLVLRKRVTRTERQEEEEAESRAQGQTGRARREKRKTRSH
jgi:hypothetical protein